MFNASRARYLQSASLLGIENDFVTLVDSTKNFNIDNLYNTYCSIAEEYRFKLGPEGDQTLFESEPEWIKRLTMGWVEFFDKECTRLASDDHFCLNVLKAVCYSETPKGKKAVAGLISCMDNKYDHSMSNWKRHHFVEPIKPE